MQSTQEPISALHLLLFGSFVLWVPSASAGEPPKTLVKGLDQKLVLLFPTVSEIQTALQSNGIRLASSYASDVRVRSAPWSELDRRDRELRLGALIGTLAFSSTSRNHSATLKALEEIERGALALGIDAKSDSVRLLRELVRDLRGKAVSGMKLTAALDGVRRQALRDATEVMDEPGLARVLAGAWLRGGALVARRIEDDAQAAKVAELVARAELLSYLKRLTGPSEQKVLARAETLAKKTSPTARDLVEFADIAEKILN